MTGAVIGRGGYSKRLVNEQIELLQKLNRILRSTECFRAAEASGRLIRVPTGDGMALLFFRSPKEPVRCALEISKTLQDLSIRPSIGARHQYRSKAPIVGLVTQLCLYLRAREISGQFSIVELRNSARFERLLTFGSIL
jgi:hypothetical protein